MAVSTGKENNQNPFKSEDDGMELIFVDKKKDVYRAQAVIGPAPMQFYHDKIVKDLVEQAVKKMKPELVEKEGYEIMKYEIIIKQHKA